eukprot:Gb_36961 [translate_table: standard]
MASFSTWASICVVWAVLILSVNAETQGAVSFPATHVLGINYGCVADNLPPPSKAVELMKNIKVGYVKIYDADHEVLKALAGFQVVITVKNEDINEIATNSSKADEWVKNNVFPFYPSTGICMIMHSLDKSIVVTTSVSMDALGLSFPPSSGAFREDIAQSIIKPILEFLSRTDSYFFLNAYPYFTWKSNPNTVSLDYAMPNLRTVVVKDGLFEYTNLLDTQLDSVVDAMEKLGYPHVNLALSETGWPSKGDSPEEGANIDNAARYNRGLISKIIVHGTPRRPQAFIPTFVSSLFNEDQKPGATIERHFGLFQPDETPVYSIDFYGDVSWCVANPAETEQSILQGALDHACSEGADYSAIQPGQSCYEPNTVASHASYAFNSYWHKMKSHGETCDFNGAAILTNSNPSHDGCSFPSTI